MYSDCFSQILVLIFYVFKCKLRQQTNFLQFVTQDKGKFPYFKITFCSEKNCSQHWSIFRISTLFFVYVCFFLVEDQNEVFGHVSVPEAGWRDCDFFSFFNLFRSHWKTPAFKLYFDEW